MSTVLVHGVFDLLHEGHLEHLEKAKKFASILIVSVVSDKYVVKGKPIYKERTRVRLLKALRCVDEVILCRAPGPQKIIAAIRPDYYVRGSDYRGKEMPESGLLRKLGIAVRYTKSIPPRTGDIIRKIRK